MKQTLIEAPRRAILEMLKKEYHKEFEFPHVTELIYCLTKSYYDRVQPIQPTDKEMMLFATGYGMQKLIIPGRGVTGECEGIHWSADQLSMVVDGEVIVGELKCTRMSTSKTDLPEGWYKQIIVAHLIIFGLMGNYRPPFPDIVVWKLEFTETELIDNWEWLKMRWKMLDLMIKGAVPLEPTVWCMDWECPLSSKKAACRYQILCEGGVK